MKAIFALALGAIFVGQAHATSPIGIGPDQFINPPVVVAPPIIVVPGRRPLFPRRPILVPVVPVQPVNPLAELPWIDLGVRSYSGPGTNYEEFRLGRTNVAMIRLRVPAQCVLSVTNVEALSRGYNVGTRRSTTYTEAGYNNAVYQVNATEIDAIRMTVSSNVAYRDFNNCGVRAFTYYHYAPIPFPQPQPLPVYP